MTLTIEHGTTWPEVYRRARAAAPEAFDAGRLLNYWGGRWRAEGVPAAATSPLDGSAITGPPKLGVPDATRAVRASLNEHRTWSVSTLDERRWRVAAAVDELAAHRGLLALLLVWENGETWASAASDVDRCVDGVRRYLAEIDGMLTGRGPLPGPVSNIGRRDCPTSVLIHAMLVQALAGNAVIAKAPSAGGVNVLTLATALAARGGLPLTLVSGSGSELAGPLMRSPMIGCLSFVGGRGADLADSGKRLVREQEGTNCWGVWEFTDWATLAGHVRSSFEYGGQRRTWRYVVQRSLFDEFRAACLPAVREASPPYHAGPFGLVDTVVLVDTEAELTAAMNASDGVWVASLACADEATAQRLAGNLRAAEVGINLPCSRGRRYGDVPSCSPC